jgi:hypothetical protein
MLDGWYLMTATLLLMSGGAKIADPEPTGGALRAAALPSSRLSVWALGLVEIVVGIGAIVSGHPAAAVALAGLYLAFAGFVGWAIVRRLPLQSCGCFGRSDTPPTAIHVGIDLLAAAAAAAVAVGGGVSVFDLIEDQPAAGLPYLAFIGIGTYLLMLTLAELPGLVRRAPA